jgi:hypothetical protein
MKMYPSNSNDVSSTKTAESQVIMQEEAPNREHDLEAPCQRYRVIEMNRRNYFFDINPRILVTFCFIILA